MAGLWFEEFEDLDVVRRCIPAGTYRFTQEYDRKSGE